MNIEAIDQIVNGMQVYMPSGIQAELSMDDKGNIIVKYMDDCIDIYTPDEFIQVGTEGIIPVEEQSVLMEDKHTCCLDQLEFLSKHLKDTKLKQNAITLMDAAGLGVDVEEAVKKLWKEFKKDESFDGEKPLQQRWEEEMRNYPIIDTADGPIYFEPSEDGTKIIYGSMTNGGIIPEGEIEYEADKPLDWHIQGIADEIFEKHGYIDDDWREVEFIKESLNEEANEDDEICKIVVFGALPTIKEKVIKPHNFINSYEIYTGKKRAYDGVLLYIPEDEAEGFEQFLQENNFKYANKDELDESLKEDKNASFDGGKAEISKIRDILNKYGYKIDEFTSNGNLKGLWYCTIANVAGNNDATLVQGKDYTEVLKKIKKKFGESLDKKSILDKIAADVRAEVERVYDYDKDLIEWNHVEPHIKKGHYDDDSDMYYIEVRDELGYEGMQNLADKLDPIVRKYDKRAYFDMDEPGIMSAVIDMDTVKLDETSEEKAKGTEHKRIDNFVNYKFDNTDTKKNAKKLVKNSKIMAKRSDKKKDENMSELSKLTSELTGLMEEIDAEPKKCGLIDKLRKRFNEPAAKDEAFNDEIMLTDIEELDMPDALADTIDTNDEGGVLTLGDVADEIKDLKDEVIDAVAEIKDEITDKIEDKVEEEVDEIEFLDDMEAEAEEIEDEIKDTQEDVVDLEAEDAEEAAEAEDEEAGDEEIEEKEEVEIEESFKKYLRKGQLENLQDAKQEIDKDIRSGADTEDIKTDIIIHSDTEEEEKKAKEYAASKLKECLETSKTSILSKELK